MVPCFSCATKSSPWFLLLWCSTPQPIASCSPTHGKQLLTLSSCPYTDNPSYLLDPKSQCPATTWPSQTMVSKQWWRWSITLLCLPQSSCWTFLSDFEVPLSQLSPHWLAGPQVASQGVGSFSASQLPLRNASPILIPSTLCVLESAFSIFSTQLCQEFLAPFWGLSSVASIQ